MRMESFSNISLRLAASLAIAITTGCAGEGWACGASSSGDGCFCTFDEVLTDGTAECNASQTGAPHCCDDPVAEFCSCPPAPRCWMDGDSCLCGARPPSGVIFVTDCAADPGFVCCVSNVLGICGCSFVDCPMGLDDRTTTRCDTGDVSTCDAGERPVSDCSTRE